MCSVCFSTKSLSDVPAWTIWRGVVRWWYRQCQRQKVEHQTLMTGAQGREGPLAPPDTHLALGNLVPTEEWPFCPIYWGRSRGTYRDPSERTWEKKCQLGQMQKRSVVFFNKLNKMVKKCIAGHACNHDKIHLLSPYPAPREKKLISYHISQFIYSASPRERPPHNDTKDISFIYCPSTCVFVSRWVAGKQTSVGTWRIEIVQWSLPSGC